MSYCEARRLPKKKAELEEQYRTMPDAIRQQVIPPAEVASERAELRAIAKEIVGDFRKVVVQKRRDLRKAEKELSEIYTWYMKKYGTR
jgi:hypothetical protein